MANQIPQIQESQPVLQPSSVNSGSESYEAFAKTLASLGGVAESKTEEIVSEQSQSMYINSVANAEQIKTSAQINMLENPSMAPKIARQTNEALDAITQAAFVNNKDRSRLKSYVSGVSNEVDLRAVSTEVQQRQRESAFTHYANWPDQLRAYQQALISDHDQAQHLHDAMVGSLHSLVSIGAMTPEQAATSFNTMRHVVGDVERMYRAGYDEMNAQDYHTITSNPLNRGADNTNAPINQSTKWLVDYHNNDRSFQGVLADISQRKLPDPETFVSLTPSQQEHAIMEINGVRVADGMINSGESFPSIEKAYQTLSQKGRVLNYQNQATRNALGNYIEDLKNGNYLSIIGQTPAGNEIMRNFVTNDTAIRNSPIDDAKKNQMILQNKNNMVNAAVSYADGHHIPSEYVQPIPQAEIANVENAFNLGQKPEIVLATLGQYTKQNQMYVANAMKNPDQRMIVQAVALLPNTIKPSDKLDFIAANQIGRTYVNKEIEGSTNDKTMMNRIYSNLAPSMRILGQNYDFEQAQKLQNSMLTTTLKYAKYLAQKDNNIEMKSGYLSGTSWRKYVDDASKIYASSFQQKSGTNWIVNPQQLPAPLTDSELDTLADHVTYEGYKYLKEGRKDFEYESAISRNPLKMIISPTNYVQAVDGNGKVYYSMPFTTNILPYAKESKKIREKERKAILSKEFERSVKQQLNVRLPEDVNAQ